jgi:hypothetical protein
VVRFSLALLLLSPAIPAALPRGCTGSTSLGTFHLTVAPTKGAPLPLKSIDVIPPGSHLVWDPVHLPPRDAGSAEISAALLPEPKGELIFVEPRKANKRQEWVIPKSPGVVALVYGPQGLSAGKVKKLVARNEDLLTELATYAEQTSEVEALVQELADSEDAGVPADAVLKGFASRYGVSVPKLNSSAPTNQQAGVLLSALMPTANAYDPLASGASQTLQSASLAASVAGAFFGPNIGLASGGIALFADLKAIAFPGSEFRSAFAQSSGPDSLTLCTKTATPKARTHLVYLWAYRVPNDKAPVVSLAADHIPVASKSPIRVTGDAVAVKELSRAREWRLAPVSSGTPVAIAAAAPATPADTLDLDLTKAKLAPGDYHLQAMWDWSPLNFGGVLHVHPYGDFSHIEISADSRDKLIEGSGTVPVTLQGADFEFVEKASLEKPRDPRRFGPPPAPRDLTFALPLGKRAGEQRTLEVNVPADIPGHYLLALVQSDGVKHEVPITVLPPNPKIANLPIRVNVDEASQAFRLEGSGVERIASVATDAGAVTGEPRGRQWSGMFRIKPGLPAGRRFALTVKVEGLAEPLTLEDAVEIVGPRPRIVSVRSSMPADLGIEVHDGELPSGSVVGLALSVDHLYGASGQPVVTIGCSGGDARSALKLLPNEQAGGASLTQAGPGSLFLSLDPGKVGFPGCTLTAAISTEPEGRSEPRPLGRVIRLPKVEQLSLTNEKAGPSNYAGVLKGSDLDIIEKVGWDAQNGVPVDSIPTPVPGERAKETLRVALPWPSPQPHAPLYVWLRDEKQGRLTSVSY